MERTTRQIIDENVAFALTVLALGFVFVATLTLSPENSRAPEARIDRVR